MVYQAFQILKGKICTHISIAAASSASLALRLAIISSVPDPRAQGLPSRLLLSIACASRSTKKGSHRQDLRGSAPLLCLTGRSHTQSHGFPSLTHSSTFLSFLTSICLLYFLNSNSRGRFVLLVSELSFVIFMISHLLDFAGYQRTFSVLSRHILLS